MTIWKNTCGESWQDTIENGWEGSGKPGAFLFFIPKGALTHHLLKQAVVALPLVGHVRSPRGIAAPAGAAGRCHSPVGAAVIVHADGKAFPCWKPLPHLPAQTCHRQLDTDTGVERIVPPLLVVRRISRRTCCNRVRKKGYCVSQSPFRKDGRQWRFIIWRPRWSAVEPGAPPWLLRPI